MLLLCLLIQFAVAVAALDAATRSDPFHLSIRSENATYDGKAVTTCHQGALITSLCVSDESVNLSSTAPFALNVVSTSAGALEFLSSVPPTAADPNVTPAWFPMNFDYNPYTNIAMGFFQSTQPDDPVNAAQFTFDSDGLLVMTAPIMDDSIAPNWQLSPANATVNRWFVCDTWAPAPYRTTAVVWGLGSGLPQNPTCEEVDIVQMVS